MRRLAYFVISCVAAGCGSAETPRVVVASGPQLSLAEGHTTDYAVAIEPAAGNVTHADFEVVVDPAMADYFADLAVLPGAAGELPVLRVTPRCDLVAALGANAIVPIEVRALIDGVEPAALTIQVTFDDGGACLPLIQVWRDSGDGCQAIGALIGVSGGISIDPGVEETLCVRVESLDPDNESLWARHTTSAPISLVTLPVDADDFTAQTVVIDIVANPHVVGAFDIDIDVYRADPGDADIDPAVTRRMPLEVGVEGQWAIELLTTVPEPILAPEFDATPIAFRVWAYTGRPQETICVRATRDPEPASSLPRSKPFLRLYDVADAAGGSGEVVCGDGPYTLRVSPPIDSAVIEGVLIEAAGSPAFAPKVARTVIFDAANRGDELVCDDQSGGQAPIPLVACADLDADGKPEVVVRARKACVFANVDGVYEELTWQGPERNPLAVAGFAWQGPVGPENLVLGEFDDGMGGVELMKLEVSGTSATWNAAVAAELVLPVGVSLARVAPIGEAVGATATHVAYAANRAGAWSVVFQCVSASVVSCADFEIVDVAMVNPMETARVGVSDLDGDGANDVVFTADSTDINGRRSLQVVAVPVAWPGASVSCGAPNVDCVALADQPITGDLGAMAAAPTPSAHQDLFVVAGDSDFDASLMVVPGAPSYFSSPPAEPIESLITPGPALGVVSSNGGLIAALASGVWQYDESGPIATWTLRDPVLQEDADQGAVPVTADGYGRSLAACVGSADEIVFPSSNRSVRYTHTDIPIAEP